MFLPSSPAVPAAVLLCDAILVFTPDVYGREDQSYQDGKAANQGKRSQCISAETVRERETNITKIQHCLCQAFIY